MTAVRTFLPLEVGMKGRVLAERRTLSVETITGLNEV